MSVWWNRDDVNDHIIDYHDHHAYYPNEELTRFQEQLEPLFDEYNNALAKHSIHCTREHVGSVAEGVRIVPPDKTHELDEQFIMEIERFKVDFNPDEKSCIKIDLVGLPGRILKSFIGEGHFSADKFQDIFWDIFRDVRQSWVNVFGEDRCVVSTEQGPAIKVTMHKDGIPSKYVDLVPAIRFPDGKCYVPKQRLDADGNSFKCKKKFAWRESFSLEERDQYPSAEDRPYARHCLRIGKAFCASNPEMEKLDTYILKNLLFLEIEERPDDSWEEKDVARRVLGLLLRLWKGLDERYIPQFFNADVNLLMDTSDVAMENIQRFVNSVLQDHFVFKQAFKI